MAATCALLLATVFALAALAKLRNLSAFEAVLRSLIPSSLVRISSRAVPAIELALALLLLAGVYTQLACAFAFLLLAFFGVILLHMWNKRLGGCGCFGESADSPNLLVALTRNALLMLAAVVIALDPAGAAPLRVDLSTFIAQATIVLGALCAWSCAVALVQQLFTVRT